MTPRCSMTPVGAHGLSRMLGLAAIFLLPLAGCGGGPTGPAEPLDELPRPLTSTERAIVSASNAFGFELFGRLHRDAPAENLFLSPLSGHMALGLALNAAEDETFDALHRILGFGPGLADPDSLPGINATYAGLIDLLLSLDPAVETGIGNSVWIREGFPLDPAYAARVGESFGAEARALDFDDPAAVEAINGWVSEETRGRIERMLERIDPTVQAILLNAIFFRGSWSEAFDPEQTREAEFRLADGSTKRVRMMRGREAERRTWFDPGHLAMVDLPYGRGAFVMTVVVPDGETTVDQLVEELDAATWAQWTSRLDEAEITLGLPRFGMEWQGVLNEILKAMGMEIAFDGRAHFGGIVEGPGNPGLYISEVRQKSFVEVDEEGTVAAAATSVALADRAVTAVVADRPFLFAIRERLSGTVLFLGKLTDPPPL